jgi:hypothetical protein
MRSIEEGEVGSRQSRGRGRADGEMRRRGEILMIVMRVGGKEGSTWRLG